MATSLLPRPYIYNAALCYASSEHHKGLLQAQDSNGLASPDLPLPKSKMLHSWLNILAYGKYNLRV